MALAIVGCAGLAAWTGGCGRSTLVQPDADPVDAPQVLDAPAEGGEAGDGSGVKDLGKDSVSSVDAQPMACCAGV